MMGELDPLGVFLKERRESLGLSLQQVCRRVSRLGVALSPSHLLRVERGKMPRADHLSALCHVLGVPAWQVLDLALLSGENAVRWVHKREADVQELLSAGDDLVARGCLARARTRFVVARWKAREQSDRPAELGAAARIAWVDFQQGRLASALLGFAEVVEAGESLPGDRDAARVRLFRLYVRLGWGEHVRALAGEVRRMAADRRRSVLTRAGAWCALAVYEERFGEREDAEGCWKSAMRVLAQAGYERERIRAALGYVDFLMSGGNLREAVRVTRRLERSTRKKDLSGVRSNVLDRLGPALVLAGRPGAALPFLVELVGLARDLGDDERWLRALAWEARARWMQGEEHAARRILRLVSRSLDAAVGPDTARIVQELEEVLTAGAAVGPGEESRSEGKRRSRRPRAGGAA